MKYTPEELLQQIREAKLIEPLEGLIRSGRYDYQFTELHGPVRKTGINQYSFASEEKQGDQCVLACAFGNFPEENFANTDRVTAGTVFYQDQVWFLGFWQGEDMPEELRDRMFTEFLFREGIDTKGRLKKLFRDNFEIVQR